MKIWTLSTLAILIGYTNISHACNIEGTQGIVEENDLYIPTNTKSMTNLNKMKFTQIIDRIESIYSPIIRNMGKRLVIERKWNDGTVNAYAQQEGNLYKIAMFGGLARHRTVTPDGFAVVVCHELGHHIGGAPKKVIKSKRTWASNEGQADYFGVMKCLRKYMEKDDNQKIVMNMNIPNKVKRSCQRQFNNGQDRAICQRSAMAGLSLANLFKDLTKLSTPLKFSTPDTAMVRKTNHKHPAPQCRLDTYFAGSLCQADHYTDVSSRNLHQGVCSRKFDKTIGARPRCWFKPTSRF